MQRKRLDVSWQKVQYVHLFWSYAHPMRLIGVSFTSLWGISIPLPAVPEDVEHMESWMPKITQLVRTARTVPPMPSDRVPFVIQVQSGRLKPNLVKVWPGGLDAIIDGLEYMKAGNVKAEKIVYRI